MAIKKILELKGDTWASGLALQSSSLKGGLFRSASNFDPFEQLGIMQPAKEAVRYGDATVTKQIQGFANFIASGLAYTYAYAGESAAGTTALYKINVATGATTDVSAQISTASSAARGIAVYGIRTDVSATTQGLVYAKDTTIRSNKIEVASANDIEILAGLTDGVHKFVRGADKNLYFTNGNKVGVITNVIGTSGNSISAISFEAGMRIRDIANDGRYLVIFGDDCPNDSDENGVYNNFIAFWDYTSQTITQRYDLKLGRAVAVQILDGTSYLFNVQGMFRCSVGAYPSLVFSFTGNSVLRLHYPLYASMVTMSGASIILWADRSSGAIYGYGSLGLGDKKVMFHRVSQLDPYFASAITMHGTSSSNVLVMGTYSNQLHIQGISSTLTTASLITSQIVLPQTYKLDFIRVVTRVALLTGQAVDITMNSINGDGLPSNTQTFSYSLDGAKQSKVFQPYQPQQDRFNEFYLTITSTKTPVQSIEIWGSPIDERDQTL